MGCALIRILMWSFILKGSSGGYDFYSLSVLKVIKFHSEPLKIQVHHRDHINHLLRLITGISPVSFSAPGKSFSHALTFRWLI